MRGSFGALVCEHVPKRKSRPIEPHPLFAGFIGAAVEQSRLV
jgi:CTP synthase